MIVYDLACSAGHRFEAWFRSGSAFDEQAEAGALSCPLCSDGNVTKAPMAPRVARSALRQRVPPRQGAECQGAERQAAGRMDPSPGPAASRPSGDRTGGPAAAPGPARPGEERRTPIPEALVQTLTRVRAAIEATCEDVGPRFAEEARRIHFGEAAERGIYGEASAEDAAALRDDGIVCQVLPWWRRRND